MTSKTEAQQTPTIESIADILSQIDGVRVMGTFPGWKDFRADIELAYGNSTEEMVSFIEKLAKTFGAYERPDLAPIGSATDLTEFCIRWSGDGRKPSIFIEIWPSQVAEAASVFKDVVGRVYGNVCR